MGNIRGSETVWYPSGLSQTLGNKQVRAVNQFVGFSQYIDPNPTKSNSCVLTDLDRARTPQAQQKMIETSLKKMFRYPTSAYSVIQNSDVYSFLKRALEHERCVQPGFSLREAKISQFNQFNGVSCHKLVAYLP